jgi:hypothetical protein
VQAGDAEHGLVHAGAAQAAVPKDFPVLQPGEGWIIDFTPVECGRRRPTARRSGMAGWAGYGDCASHSRFFWGQMVRVLAGRGSPRACHRPL